MEIAAGLPPLQNLATVSTGMMAAHSIAVPFELHLYVQSVSKVYIPVLEQKVPAPRDEDIVITLKVAGVENHDLRNRLAGLLAELLSKEVADKGRQKVVAATAFDRERVYECSNIYETKYHWYTVTDEQRDGTAALINEAGGLNGLAARLLGNTPTTIDKKQYSYAPKTVAAQDIKLGDLRLANHVAFVFMPLQK